MKIKWQIALMLITVLLSACAKVEPTDTVEKAGGWAHSAKPIFNMENGCTVSFLKIKKLLEASTQVSYTQDMYVVQCPAMDVTTSKWQCGKLSCSSATISPATPEEAARQEALSKLSDQDRKALGL